MTLKETNIIGIVLYLIDVCLHKSEQNEVKGPAKCQRPAQAGDIFKANKD